jgi:hypothetical protein
MTDTTVTSELGVIISNKTARKLLYGIYVLLLLAAGAAHIAYNSLSVADPSWLVAGTAVLTYLGIPVGGLAAANTVNAKITSTAAATPADPAVITSVPSSEASDATDTAAAS